MAVTEERQDVLITPAEAATIMTNRAGYLITPDDLKQLRRHGRVKAARQLRRMTLYDRSEIEHAPLPKKHNREPVQKSNHELVSTGV